MGMLHGYYTADYHGKTIRQVILEGLEEGPKSGHEMYCLFQKHLKKKDLQPVLEELLDEGLIEVHKECRKYVFQLSR